MGRAHYYSRFAVSPSDEDELYFLTASYSKSIDGGSLEVQGGDRGPGGDHHDIWIDHTNPDRMIVAHDQGLSISENRGGTWFRQRLTNAQITTSRSTTRSRTTCSATSRTSPAIVAPATAGCRAARRRNQPRNVALGRWR